MVWPPIHREMMNLVPDGVLVVDEQGRIRHANVSMQKLCGQTEAELLGRTVETLLPPEVRSRHGQHMAAYFREPESRAMGRVQRLRLWRSDELRSVPVDISLSRCSDEGHACAVAFVRDLSDLHALYEKNEHQATHDALTDLHNRNVFTELVSKALKHSARSGQPLAVMLIDLDDFKSVNDSHGHHVGDALLKEVAHRLRSALRSGDALARLGGDEFAVLLTDFSTPAYALWVADKVVQTLRRPWHHHVSQWQCRGGLCPPGRAGRQHVDPVR